MNTLQKTLSQFSALAVLILLTTGMVHAGSLSIDITPAKQNPASPQMGDRLGFHTSIKNTGTDPVTGVIGWISLLRIDKGHEAPGDL